MVLKGVCNREVPLCSIIIRSITTSLPHAVAGIPFVRQSQNAITIAAASSLVVFILSLTLFFILGCACGWVGHKHKTKQSDKNARSEAALLYEHLQPSTPTSIPGEQERATSELKENVAYGPIKSTYN